MLQSEHKVVVILLYVGLFHHTPWGMPSLTYLNGWRDWAEQLCNLPKGARVLSGRAGTGLTGFSLHPVCAASFLVSTGSLAESPTGQFIHAQDLTAPTSPQARVYDPHFEREEMDKVKEH